MYTKYEHGLCNSYLPVDWCAQSVQVPQDKENAVVEGRRADVTRQVHTAADYGDDVYRRDCKHIKQHLISFLCHTIISHSHKQLYFIVG